MRLPISDVHRAFSQLDPFSDAECQRFVSSARRAHRVTETAFRLLAIPFFVVSVIGLIFVLRWIIELTGIFGFGRSPEFENIAMVGSVIFVFATPALALLLIRDRWLHWAVSRHIGRAACDCGYSLLGLHVEDDTVLCPECGHPTVLSRRGLTPETLLQPKTSMD